MVEGVGERLLNATIGQFMGKGGFSGLFINLGGRHFDSLPAAKAATPPGATLNYGIFINNVINFLIVAFVVFLVVQQMNRLTKKPAPAALPPTKNCPQCAMTIPPPPKLGWH